MRQALMKTKIRPQERIESIKDMVKTLSQMKTTKSWGFDINSSPITFDTNVLEEAKIVADDRVVHVNEQVLRKIAI